MRKLSKDEANFLCALGPYTPAFVQPALLQRAEDAKVGQKAMVRAVVRLLKIVVDERKSYAERATALESSFLWCKERPMWIKNPEQLYSHHNYLPTLDNPWHSEAANLRLSKPLSKAAHLQLRIWIALSAEQHANNKSTQAKEYSLMSFAI